MIIVLKLSPKTRKAYRKITLPGLLKRLTHDKEGIGFLIQTFDDVDKLLKDSAALRKEIVGLKTQVGNLAARIVTIEARNEIYMEQKR